jgi:hypothetical protein
MLISIEGHSVADFDTQSAFNRWQTTTINTNRHYDYDIFNRQINIHLEVRHKVIGIKRCHHGMSV